MKLLYFSMVGALAVSIYVCDPIAGIGMMLGCVIGQLTAWRLYGHR